MVRALLTETERANIAGENGDQRKYESISRVRSRIDGQLREDVEHLAEHHEDLLEELQEVVCKVDGGQDD
ncbi:hypothetical protein [Natrinema sp. DC36]|uniref:hypothetical protein n=1 Tax=Natrinema sp. DC36 TaxID=2878680 RepID=UPI001CEFFA10|nr:hypothetical protein [Natrinema sp. DC36]